MISSEQIRAARALIRWSALDLAQNSGIGVATIRRIEMADGIPSSNAKTLDQIQKTLEAAGIEFVGTPEDSPGVRFKKLKDKFFGESKQYS
ncbi:MAG: transcriptional regulator [Betaproteobacteria bacterium]|nr:transcriptional regulator [Betaproteobacteria bacterium]